VKNSKWWLGPTFGSSVQDATGKKVDPKFIFSVLDFCGFARSHSGLNREQNVQKVLKKLFFKHRSKKFKRSSKKDESKIFRFQVLDFWTLIPPGQPLRGASQSRNKQKAGISFQGSVLFLFPLGKRASTELLMASIWSS
jgi:hypothetical protein